MLKGAGLTAEPPQAAWPRALERSWQARAGAARPCPGPGPGPLQSAGPARQLARGGFGRRWRLPSPPSGAGRLPRGTPQAPRTPAQPAWGGRPASGSPAAAWLELLSGWTDSAGSVAIVLGKSAGYMESGWSRALFAGTSEQDEHARREALAMTGTGSCACWLQYQCRRCRLHALLRACRGDAP